MGVKVKVKRQSVVVKKRRLSAEQKAKRAEREEKQMQALELRSSGATYQQIANALGLTYPATAKRYVDRAMDRLIIEAGKDVIRLDLARLDEMQMRATHALRQNGDLGQIDRLMRIMEFRYRLLGVDNETVRAMQQEVLGTTANTVVNNKNQVMNIHIAPETEQEFIAKMMRSVGVDPDSPEAQKYLEEHKVQHELPMLSGSANEAADVRANSEVLSEHDMDIVDAEVVAVEEAPKKRK